MKIKLSDIDTEQFTLKYGVINNKDVILIIPDDIKCKWTKDTLNLRSLLVDTEGNIISHAFKKFFNATEKSDLYPDPTEYNDWVLTNKEDGSLMICDWIYDTLNVRTRGVIDYSKHDTAGDFDYILNKYDIKGIVQKYPNYTFLFEIYNPNQIIVLKPYDTPEIYFLGVMDKDTGNYIPFYSEFGKFVASYLNCKVPEIYTMKGSILEIAAQVKLWERKEGLVLNYNNNQNRIKIKADWYLFRHALKSKLNSIDNLIDLFLDLNCPDYNTFFNNIVETIDFETATEYRGNISSISDAYKEVQKIMDGIDNFVNVKIRPLSTRKDQAMLIESSYGKSTGRTSMCYSRLDNKPWNKEQIKKLLFQCLKRA